MIKQIRKVVSNIVSAVLLVVQYIPVVGPWHGVMLLPIIMYFVSVLMVYPEFILLELSLFFATWHFIFSKIIILAGIIIFFVALMNFRKRTTPISTHGLYSKIRHPQYLGLMITTLGFTLMSVELTGEIKPLGIWLIALIGYIFLAYSEEKHLLKKHYKLYKQYMEQTNFMLPIKSPKNLPEPLFTLFFMLGFAFLYGLVATVI